MIKIETITKQPREGFIYGLIGLTLSFVFGFILGTLKNAHFIQEKNANFTILQNDAIAANLLVVASLLIGVAVVQGQNLNRVNDILRQVKSKRSGSILEFIGSQEAAQFITGVIQKLKNPGNNSSSAMFQSTFPELETRMAETRKKGSEQIDSINDLYDELLAGFWILSFDVLIVLLLLFVVSFVGNDLSLIQVKIVSGLWWTSIIAIIFGWWRLMKVALYTYRVEED